jgi:ABC-type multidrug transport system permease subunit
MSSKSSALSRRLGVIWAITSKDLLDAIKNKTTLSVFLPALLMLIFYRFIPQIYGHDDLVSVYLHDPNDSGAIVLLEDRSDLEVHEVDSLGELEQAVSNSDVPEVGISLPADFNLEAKSPLELDAYVIYWVPEAERINTVNIVEQELAYLLDRPVTLKVDGNTVYHRVDSDGLGFLASVSITFVLVMTGIAFLPNLMLEEHKEKTMQLLRISPASPSDIIIAKGLTGLFYSLLMSAVAWMLFRRIFVNPVMTAATFLIGSLLFVSLGLLLGGVVKTRQQLMMIAWVIILPLLLPPFMEMMDDILPATLLRVIRFIPSVSLARVLRSGLTNQPDWGFFFGQFAYLTGIVLILFSLNVLSIRRRDR